MRDTLVQLKLVEPDVAARALAQEIGRPYVDLADMLPDDSILDLVPRALVRRHTCLPLFIDNGGVLVACSEEPDSELEDEIRLRFNLPIRPVMATPLAINQAIAKYYAAGLRKEVAEPVKGGKSSSSSAASKSKVVLSDDEKAQKKQLGILGVCWAIIGFVLLDTFVLYDFLYKKIGLPEMVPFSGILIGAPLAYLIYVTQVKGK